MTVQVHPGTLHLNDTERMWVTRKWAAIREAQALADAASNNWRRLSDEINDYLDRSRITDMMHRTAIKGESLALKDAFVVGEWHAHNSQRHIDDLTLFLRLKELELL